MTLAARLFAVVSLTLVGLAGPGPGVPDAHAASLVEVTGFGTNPGNLRMFKYVPDGLPAGKPLVVAMHGCTQSAASYDAETGWTKYADLWQFALVLPQQQSANNSSSCFNWFEPGDQARGGGEVLSIKQMVDKMKTDHGSDAARVYSTGLSAGGAMTPVTLAAYPDVFKGGAIVAGIPFKCATTLSQGFSCMNPGVDKTPQQWGDLVRAAFPSWTGPWPKVSIWHGDADWTVRPMNMTESVDQWTNVNGADQTPDVQDTVKGYPHKVYNNGSGTPIVETFTLTGMGHGQPLDPGTATDQCGTAGAYMLDVNICASYHIAKFWRIDAGGGGGGDTQAPSVNVTAPANGATVSGSVSIQATATDNVGVTNVEFYVDGALVGNDTTSPYSVSWNSASVPNGSHALMAMAYDAASNVGIDNDTSVNVNNTGGGSSATFNNQDANDGYVKANANGSSPAVGTLESSYGLGIGRGADAKYNRTVLSFNTSSIPDGATVTRAWVTVLRNSSSGDPWANPAGNQLVVGVKTGCFGACTIETGDWAASETASSAATIAKWTSGSTNSTDFGSSGRAAISKTGTTQLKLRFTLNQSAMSYIFVDNGATAQLHVEYV